MANFLIDRLKAIFAAANSTEESIDTYDKFDLDTEVRKPFTKSFFTSYAALTTTNTSYLAKATGPKKLLRCTIYPLTAVTANTTDYFTWALVAVDLTAGTTTALATVAAATAKGAVAAIGATTAAGMSFTISTSAIPANSVLRLTATESTTDAAWCASYIHVDWEEAVTNDS